MKKLLALALVLCVALSCVIPATAESETPVLVIARPADALIEDYETNTQTLLLEEEFGVDLQFLVLPSEDASAKLAVLVNSGSELPDIINMELSTSDIVSYANKGVLLPIDDFFYDDEKMGAYYDPYYELTEKEYDLIRRMVTMADGHIYSLPAVNAGPWNQTPVKMWINMKFLENLGLEVPTTTEEFKAVLKAFVEDDPNGNGEKDEIGLVGGASGWPTANIIAALIGSFAPDTYSDGYYYVEDGQIKAGFIEDRFRDGLAYIYDLVQEGLIYPASFTQDATQFKAIVADVSKDYVSGIIVAASDSGWWSDYAAESLQMLPPVIGPDGAQWATHKDFSASQKWFITSDCSDPELALTLGASGYRPESSMMSRYGIYGVNWTDDPEICANYEGKMPGSGYQLVYAILDDTPWTNIQNDYWRQALPFLETNASLAKKGGALKKSDSERTPNEMWSAYYMTWTNDRYCKYAYPDTVGPLAYTEDETYAMADLKTSLSTYVNENITLFATGGRSLAEWDAYVQELDAIGLQDYIAIMQQAYDRMNG
ncbi:MAG: extracellular solute-binding protein [Clostridia bacterium]|nr:extracellular solute-binding protein [Clostridia bacterium]